MRQVLFLMLTAVGVIGCGSPAAHPPAPADAGTPAGAKDAAALLDGSIDLAMSATMLGATLGANGITFRVWAPHATTVRVTGDFADAPLTMTPTADGVFQATSTAAHVGNSYAYALDTPNGTIARLDPYCRQLSSTTTCALIDPASYAWNKKIFVRPARADTVVYELHVGSFAVAGGAANGTFASAASALPGLADLGVDAIELMPVQSFGGGSEGWGYNPQLYFAPKSTYGSADDLRALVDAAHQQGIAVWMDTVVNHCDAWSRAPLHCFDGSCAAGSAGIYFFPAGAYATTPWGPRPNYADPQVLAMLLASADVWLDEFHGDGFRWDSVANIRARDGSGATPGGQALLTQANDRIHARGGFSVAEDLKGYAAITESTASGGYGFDAQWDGFGGTITGQLTVADGSRDLGQVIAALRGSYDGDPFRRVIYTEDHDTVGSGARLPNEIDAGAPSSFAARKLSIEGAVLLLTAPGVPMLFAGQESFALGGFADPPAPLAAPTPQGLQIRAFYRDMIRLRRNLDGGAGGLGDSNIEVFHRNDAAKVLAYRRYGASGQDVVVIVNLMNKAYTEYDIGVADAGPWRIRLNTDSTAYSSDFAAGQTGSVTAHAASRDGKPYTLPLMLGAYSAMVLSH